jgi:hypothetical protein
MNDELDVTDPMEGEVSAEYLKKMALELAYDELHCLRLSEAHSMLRDFLQEKYEAMSVSALSGMYEERFWYVTGKK